MDAEGGLLDLALPGQHAAVEPNLHKAARRDLGPVQPERDLVIAVGLARDRQGQVIEDTLVEAVLDRQAVRRGEVDARLALGGGGLVEGNRIGHVRS